ncbi:MAG: hypothetical protein LBC67_02035 [Spirochaetales bacterium]|jgi:hypothetical protein|nr:hypothetical protein [Spirochaetales bacterium]
MKILRTKNLGAFFDFVLLAQNQKTGLSAAIPQKMPAAFFCGISAPIPCAVTLHDFA